MTAWAPPPAPPRPIPTRPPAGTRAIRGGAYDSNPETCRSAARDELEPGYATCSQGFRAVRFVR